MEQKAIELARQACELDREQKYEEALDMYSKALEYFMSAIKCTRRARGVRGRWAAAATPSAHGQLHRAASLAACVCARTAQSRKRPR